MVINLYYIHIYIYQYIYICIKYDRTSKSSIILKTIRTEKLPGKQNLRYRIKKIHCYKKVNKIIKNNKKTTS